MDFETAAYQSVAPKKARRPLKQSGVELPSEDHVWWKGGGSALLDQVEQFLRAGTTVGAVSGGLYLLPADLEFETTAWLGI